PTLFPISLAHSHPHPHSSSSPPTHPPPPPPHPLPLHDALPISPAVTQRELRDRVPHLRAEAGPDHQDRARLVAGPHEAVRDPDGDRMSTRLNSSHLGISYAVFCLKKKKKINNRAT